jgi:hypothetical protein
MKIKHPPIYDPMTKRIRIAVCKKFNKRESTLKIKCRKRDIVLPRQIMHYLAKKYTKYSLAAIGSEYPAGNKPFDHTTIRHSVKTVLDLMDTDSDLRNDIHEIEYQLGFDPKAKRVSMEKRLMMSRRIKWIRVQEVKNSPL